MDRQTLPSRPKYLIPGGDRIRVGEPLKLFIKTTRTSKGRRRETALWLLRGLWHGFQPLLTSIRPDLAPPPRKAAWKEEDWESAEGPA